jgi:hypothetical protein
VDEAAALADRLPVGDVVAEGEIGQVRVWLGVCEACSAGVSLPVGEAV